MKRGWAVWITGLPASGKSTLARALSQKLARLGVRAQILESDALRAVLTPRPTYDPEERETFYSSMIFIGSLLSENGVNVLFDATAHRRAWRDKAREMFPDFMEVYVGTPLEVCRQRDPKGIYRKAARGEAATVPGPQQSYEMPEEPEVVVWGTEDPEGAAEKILEAMHARGILPPTLAGPA